MSKLHKLESYLRERMWEFRLSPSKIAQMRLELISSSEKYNIRPNQWALITSTISSIMEIETALDEILMGLDEIERTEKCTN